MLPGHVIGPAFIDQDLPRAVGGIADGIAAAVMNPGHLPHLGPAVAVRAGAADLDPAFAHHPFVRVRIGIGNPAGERGAARGKRPAQSGIRQAGGERHRGAARTPGRSPASAAPASVPRPRPRRRHEARTGPRDDRVRRP